MPESITRNLTASEFQRQCFEEILDFLKQIRIKKSEEKKNFTKREVTELLTYCSIPELYNKCAGQLKKLIKDYPDLEESIGRPMQHILNSILDYGNNGLRLLDIYGTFAAIKKTYLKEENEEKYNSMELFASEDAVYMKTNLEKYPPDRKFMDEFEKNRQDKEYLSSVMRICKDVRERSRSFTKNEISSIWSAYTMLSKGRTLDFSGVGLGTSGFRGKRHTLIFTTDPGDDHIRVTSTHKDFIDGVAVHVEHIDRDEVSSKEAVEAYRLPAAINASRVRLHIADSAPVTAFIGRPVFENANEEKGQPISHDKFKMDKLKSVHMSASACSAMFLNGVSDCKIAVERMYLKDAVEFMKSVVGNVFRESGRQTLAAAFNLNTTYYDDKYHTGEEQEPDGRLTDPFEIAKTAILVAADGGFDRVTWDGASDQIPSEPIIDQLTHAQFTQLVHMAHEKGLQTYFSAGLKAEHVARCVYTGVDGLGIGTSLHYIDPDTKLIGAFYPKAIRDTLKARNIAESTLKGRGAVLLARLDRLYFEKVLSGREDEKRLMLYEAVCTQNEEKIAKLLKDPVLVRISEMKEDTEHPAVERGKRMLRYMKRLNSEDEEMMQGLETAIDKNDIELLEVLFEEQMQ